MTKRIVFTAAMLIAAACVLAQCGVQRELRDVEPLSLTTGTIIGTVTDSLSRKPIVGAELTLLSAEGDSLRDQQSHAFSFAPRGEYRFGSVRPGSYQLRARADGYQPMTMKIGRLSVGERFTVTFALRKIE